MQTYRCIDFIEFEMTSTTDVSVVLSTLMVMVVVVLVYTEGHRRHNLPI